MKAFCFLNRVLKNVDLTLLVTAVQKTVRTARLGLSNYKAVQRITRIMWGRHPHSKHILDLHGTSCFILRTMQQAGVKLRLMHGEGRGSGCRRAQVAYKGAAA